MAVWQIGFFVLPKTSLNSINKIELSGEHSFNDAPFWQSQKIEPSFFDPINNILPRAKSWGDYLILYGNENSNRFEVVFENDIVESVSFRIDFTSNYETTLRELIEFFILNDLIVLDENLNLLQLNFEIFRSAIEDSPQVKRYRTLLNE